MSNFEIHPTLQESCHLVAEPAGAHLLLNKNAIIPWFILVPHTEIQDFLDLPPHQRHEIDAICANVSNFIRSELGSPKINFAAIGNLVPQMHLHIVGRDPNDPCWPAPIWGNLKETAAYSEEKLESIRLKLETVLKI